MKPELKYTPHPGPRQTAPALLYHLRPCRRLPGGEGMAAGFTLLEVMIALSIVSIALVAIIGLMGDYVRNLQSLQERTFAHWVAMNRVVELQLADAWSESSKDKEGTDETSLFPMQWVQSVSETPYESMKKVEIEVYAQQGDEPLTRLTTYVGRESSW